jgi:hypothetical protein
VQGRTNIALYGNSLFIAGVAAGLKDLDNVDVVRITTPCTNIEEQLRNLAPDVLIIELNDSLAHFVLSFLINHPGLPVIGLDLESSSVLTIHSYCSRATTVHQLAHMIESQLEQIHACVSATSRPSEEIIPISHHRWQKHELV